MTLLRERGSATAKEPRGSRRSVTVKRRLLERGSGGAIAGLAGGLVAAIEARGAMRVAAVIEGPSPA
jgi:uncharacterized protein YcfJ